MKLLRALAASFSYFSILPTRSFETVPDADAIKPLPLVGATIGLLAGLGGYGVWHLTHSPTATAITAWVLSIALSGAIHVDGFLDCCDGLFAMETPERRLQIMRDPHHGTYAIVGMAILTVVWIYALSQIPPDRLVVAMFMTATISRLSVQSIAGEAITRVLAVALMVVITPSLVALAVALFAKRRLGGVRSGDVFGAMIVTSEVAMLLAVPYVFALR